MLPFKRGSGGIAYLRAEAETENVLDCISSRPRFPPFKRGSGGIAYLRAEAETENVPDCISSRPRFPPFKRGSGGIAYLRAEAETEDVPDCISSRPRLPPRLSPIKKSAGEYERELKARLKVARQKVPSLSRADTSMYRTPFHELLLKSMLQEGNHRSFSELFTLLKRQNAERERAGPGSFLWNQVMLKDEHEKLSVLKHYLSSAECALREERYGDMFDSQFALARYFLPFEDYWLSDHFFRACLETCGRIPDDERCRAVAHQYNGMAAARVYRFETADQHYQTFYKLSKGQDWEDEHGLSLHSQSCIALSRIYDKMAKSLEVKDLTQALERLTEAYEYAKESKDTVLEGLASFELGLGYERCLMFEDGIPCLKKYHDICKLKGDHHGLCMAHEAIGRSYLELGDVEKCLEHYRLFMEAAKQSDVATDSIQASTLLGMVYNSISRYEEASEALSEAYDITKPLKDVKSMDKGRVNLGIAFAHTMLGKASKQVDWVTPFYKCSRKLLQWKDERQIGFDWSI